MNKTKQKTLDILAFLQSGGSIEETAERFGISVSNVNYVRGRYGLTKKHIEITETVIETIRQYRHEGKTNKEIAEYFNASITWLDNVISKHGLTNDYKKGLRVCDVCGTEYEAKIANQCYCSLRCRRKALRKRTSNAADDTAIKKRIAEKYTDFEYAGNYTGSNGTVDLKCKACGSIITRNSATLRKSDKRIVCEYCYEAEQEQKEAERKQREAEREEMHFQKRKEHIKAEVKRIATSKRICKGCGESFRAIAKNTICCSAECQRRYTNAVNDRNRRAKIKNALVDTDITLERVYEKDDGICYLCGDACEWIDYTDDNGVFIAGESYPSIDHVIPLSKGGKHSWSNVRLAHMYCNTLKSDAV